MEKRAVIQYEIVPSRKIIDFNIPELWRYRELFYIFAWRDIKVRYKQTVLGVAWAIFQPLLIMVIFTIFFGNLAKVPSDGIVYPIFVYSGLLFWTYFSSALTSTGDCLISNEGIIKKIYFPRLILPLATSLAPVIDFFFALLVLFGLMVYFHIKPNPLGLILIPALIIISLFSAGGLGLFFAAINAKYRDVRYILPFFIQLLMFITPVIYPVSIIPRPYQWMILLNPLSGVINIARASLLNTSAIEWRILLFSFLMSLILLAGGVAYFRKTERFFADIL